MDNQERSDNLKKAADGAIPLSRGKFFGNKIIKFAFLNNVHFICIVLQWEQPNAKQKKRKI
jgi:hypothetical protein